MTTHPNNQVIIYDDTNAEVKLMAQLFLKWKQFKKMGKEND